MGLARPSIYAVKITNRNCNILAQIFFIFKGTETAQHASEEEQPSVLGGGGDGDDGLAGADSDKENVPDDGRVEYWSDEGGVDGSGGDTLKVLKKVRL